MLLQLIAKQPPSHLKSFTGTTWKGGILKTLVDITCFICSNIALRKKDIDHLKKEFHEKNDYIKWVTNYMTSVNNVSEKSQVSPVTDLKRHLFSITVPRSERRLYYLINDGRKGKE